MCGVPMTNLPRSRIRLDRVPNRILEPTHRAAIVIHPARFILGLIQVIHVMAQRMMQHPRVARDARLQCIHLLEQPIEPRRLECRDVLMVMIKRANAAFGEDTEERPTNQRPHVVDERVHEEIATEHQRKAEDGKPILPISKETHECLADQAFDYRPQRLERRNLPRGRPHRADDSSIVGPSRIFISSPMLCHFLVRVSCGAGRVEAGPWVGAKWYSQVGNFSLAR